jgi:putative SOS response-associated peptidase YedK
VHEGHARRLVSLRWGLIPSWAMDLTISNKLLNPAFSSSAIRDK